MGEVTLTVEDGLEQEVALAIIGRATDIHDSAADNESVALELRDVGQQLYAEYADDAPDSWGEIES